MILLSDSINTPVSVIDHPGGYGKENDTLHVTERQTALRGGQAETMQNTQINTYWVYIALAGILFFFNYNLGKK